MRVEPRCPDPDRRHDRLQDRECCDGLCTQGQPCPAMRLALRQGVVSGPHRAPGLVARCVQALQRAARRVW